MSGYSLIGSFFSSIFFAMFYLNLKGPMKRFTSSLANLFLILVVLSERFLFSSFVCSLVFFWTPTLKLTSFNTLSNLFITFGLPDLSLLLYLWLSSSDIRLAGLSILFLSLLVLSDDFTSVLGWLTERSTSLLLTMTVFRYFLLVYYSLILAVSVSLSSLLGSWMGKSNHFDFFSFR